MPSHRHRCPRCGWNWECECATPDDHHQFCPTCARAFDAWIIDNDPEYLLIPYPDEVRQ